MSSESIDHLNEETTAPSPSWLSNEQTCHILPCNIDYQGMSPSHFFFRPVELSDGCCSSTLRGRGLTALKEDKRKESNFALLCCQNETISVKASIESMVEWHHEHDPETIQCDDGCKSRVAVAQGWLEVSHALHDPIPVEN